MSPRDPRFMSLNVSHHKEHQYILDLGPAIDPPPSPTQGNFVHHNFLKLHCIRNKMTHVSPLAMGAFTCHSHVTNVTLKTIEIL